MTLMMVAVLSVGMTACGSDGDDDNKGGNDGFGVIDHATGRYIGSGEQAVRAMVDSWENNDPSYTLQSIYDSAPTSTRK